MCEGVEDLGLIEHTALANEVLALFRIVASEWTQRWGCWWFLAWCCWWMLVSQNFRISRDGNGQESHDLSLVLPDITAHYFQELLLVIAYLA